MENMKFLGEGLKQIPINLHNIELILNGNNLGENTVNMKFLGDGLKQLPNNLHYLTLFK